MPYQIRCDGFILDDPRDEELSVHNPVVNLEVNTVGGCTFTIHKNHPYYGKLKKLKSVFEVSDEIGVIFRGRMPEDAIDFYNSKAVDLEGAMAYFNDSRVRPFSFPEDFLEDDGYAAAAESGNVIEFFLNWLIENHNSQVQEFQKFKLGNVTVSDPNNYLSRSNADYANTWETLKSKLFGSALGGYLCIRYEADGNYIDYLSEFTLTNTQEIVFGENLLDLKSKANAYSTYSAIVPLGAKGDDSSTGKRLTIESLPDGNITDDLVKIGDTIYSQKAVDDFGWVCAPTKETTWDDVTEAENLRTKGVNALSGDMSQLTSTIEITFIDLHFTDEQIRAFRIYRNVSVSSDPHGHSGIYVLSKLALHLHNPQNSKITVGKTERTLTDINDQKESDTIQRIESTEKDIAENRENVSYVKDQLLIQNTQIINDCEQIILAALESYVETSNFEEFKQTIESELLVMADRISMNFESTTEHITNVNGDLQSVVEMLEKHFEFSVDGLVIKAGENSMNLVLDNDMIKFVMNGQQFGWWDGVDFHTGNIMIDVTERAQFGNFAYVPRSNGSLDFLKVDNYIMVSITSHPQNQTVTATYKAATFSVTASGVGLSYKWQTSVDGSTWNNMNNSTTSSISVMFTTTTEKLRYYRCVVTDERGKTAISNAATFKLNA